MSHPQPATSMDTSTSLLDSLKADSDSAWDAMYALYSPMIRSWLRRFSAPGNDLEDLIQEILLVVMRKIASFNRVSRRGAFRSWLRTITYNCLRDHWKRNKQTLRAAGGSDFREMLDQLADPQSGISRIWNEEYERHVTSYLLARIRPTFSERTWRAFQRFALDDVSADEVAQELDITPNAVFIAKSRVLAKLREMGKGILDD